MALNVEPEAINGFHRASTLLGDGTLLYCDSACLDTAALWLAEAQHLDRKSVV